MAHGASKFDFFYRSLLLSRFFTRGWGRPEHLKKLFELRRKLAHRDVAIHHVRPDYPVTITKDKAFGDHRILEGHFVTPMVNFLPELIPKETVLAHFQAVLPLSWPDPGFKPIVVVYPGTGDHYFWRRRRFMALPLLRERGYGSISIECPFYGLRKPREQVGSCLRNVTDLFIMGACLMLESLVLFQWCEREGLGPLVSHGISMGGHMASLAATVWPKPIPLVPCLSWTSASTTFTRGVMTGSIPWDLLSKQYHEYGAYKAEIFRMLSCEENAFRAGQEFVQNLDKRAAESDTKMGRLQAVKEDTGDPSSPSGSREDSRNSDAENPVEPEKEHLTAAGIFSSSFFESFGLPFVSKSSNDKRFEREKSAYRRIDLGHHLPALGQVIPSLIGAGGASHPDHWHREAVQFMRGIMDECTHFKNYDVPVDPSLIIIVLADRDAYQPREGIMALPDIWPGAQTRYISGSGHVTSYLFKQDVFRAAIYDAMEIYVEKYRS